MEELNDRRRDERRRIRRLGLISVGSSKVGRVVDVVVQVVDVVVVDCESFSGVSSGSNRLGKDADESESEVVSHVDHLLEVPVRSGVVGEGSEIVVDRVGVPRGGAVERVDLNPRADRSIDSIAEGADLWSENKEVREDISRGKQGAINEVREKKRDELGRGRVESRRDLRRREPTWP